VPGTTSGKGQGVKVGLGNYGGDIAISSVLLFPLPLRVSHAIPYQHAVRLLLIFSP